MNLNKEVCVLTLVSMTMSTHVKLLPRVGMANNKDVYLLIFLSMVMNKENP